ncbi:MAG: class I SAM-dependent methyltransferase [Patescibacteria group bacterium]
MADFKKKYDAQPWTKDFAQDFAEVERVKSISNIIPKDVCTILDAGCGNGFFINFLKQKNSYTKLTGLDYSEEALKHVQTDKIQGDVTALPFADNSFDLVTCLEVLEHLPQEDLKKGISELQRVSKKYILITVPNDENLQHNLRMCPNCYCCFNTNFHVNSFNDAKLKNLFPQLQLIKLEKIGSYYKKYHLFWPFYAIYINWQKANLPKIAICPQCGYQNKKVIKNSQCLEKFSAKKISPIKFLIKFIIPGSKQRRWIMALYKK